MRSSKFILIILAATLIFPFSANATKYAGEFLTIGTGARALGMGGAFTATADDASATFWNPAGLPYIKTQQAIVMHAEQFKDLVNYDCLSYSRPFGDYSALGATFIRLSVPDVPDTRDAWLDANNNGQVDAGELDYSKITYGDDTEMALLLSYSRWLRQGISVGGNVKLIRKSVFDYSAWGFGLDIAGHYKYNENLSFGVNLQDITTTPLIWNDDAGTTETISPTLKMGVAYSRNIAFGTLTLATDIDWRFEGREEAAQFNMGAISGDLRLGAEYWLKDHLAFRLGSAEGNFTAGAGLKLYMFQVDYAFLGHKDLDNTHRISALVSF